MNVKNVTNKAKLALEGNMISLVIINFIITCVFLLVDRVADFVGIIPTILIMPLYISQAIIYLRVVRGEHFDITDVGLGFQNYLTNLITVFLTTLFTGLWSLLFVVPGIIKFHSYAMTPFIIAENPNMSSSQAITKSRKMMDGHKMELFKAYLHIFLIYLVVTIVFVIAEVATMPTYEQLLYSETSFIFYGNFPNIICNILYICFCIYMYPLYYAVVAQFYIELKANNEEPTTDFEYYTGDAGNAYYNDNAQEKLDMAKVDDNDYYEDEEYDNQYDDEYDNPYDDNDKDDDK